MGSTQSARKLTVINEEEVGVIKVSNAIVERLAQSSRAVNENSKDVRSISTSQAASRNVMTQTPQVDDVSPGLSQYQYPMLTLSALEMQRKMEQELQMQEEYWQKRLENLEKKHIKIDHILEEEYKKAVNEFLPNETDKKKVFSNERPCTGNSEKVRKCFEEYPKETLKCLSVVEEFTNCVDQQRTNIIAARC